MAHRWLARAVTRAPSALPLPPPTVQIHPLPGFHEPFSAISHLVGAAVFAVLGARLLLHARGDAARVAFLSVYVACGVFLLSMSGVFHMLREGSTARAVLGRLDLAGIFLLIAGTHTPVQGLFFRGAARWVPFAVMWGAVATGITMFSVFYGRLPHGLGNTVFIVLGWIAGVSGLVVWRRLGTRNVLLLLGGGVVYSVGAILMGIGWPTLLPGVVGPHELWHVAVLSAMWMHWRFFWRFACSNEPGRT